MKYTTKEFGLGLMAEINKGYEPTRIARWAFARLTDPDHRIDCKELHDLILTVVAMEEGPEFEYSEQDLRELANRLAQA
jgi:hypothetical protein